MHEPKARPHVSAFASGSSGAGVPLVMRASVLALLFLVEGCSGASAQREPPLSSRLSDGDAAMAAAALQAGLARSGDGETLTWDSGETRAAGAVTPLATYVTSTGYFCREYRESLHVGERRESATGTACLNEAGTWVRTATDAP